MTSSNSVTMVLLRRFREIREAEGVSQQELEQHLILGPDWIERFESGETTPSIEVLYALLQALGKDFSDLFEDLPPFKGAAEFVRKFHAERSGDDLIVHFPYSKHDAQYLLLDASLEEFESVIKILRDGLAKLVILNSCIYARTSLRGCLQD